MSGDQTASSAPSPTSAIPEWGVMLQGGKKAPAPSSSAAYTGRGAPVSLAVKVVVMMEASLRHL